MVCLLPTSRPPCSLRPLSTLCCRRAEGHFCMLHSLLPPGFHTRCCSFFLELWQNRESDLFKCHLWGWAGEGCSPGLVRRTRWLKSHGDLLPEHEERPLCGTHLPEQSPVPFGMLPTPGFNKRLPSLTPTAAPRLPVLTPLSAFY